MGRFDAKVALVTGSTQGLGEAIAHRFTDEGAAGIVVTGRNADRGAAVAAGLRARGCEAIFVPADLATPDAPAKIIDATDAAFGRLDILVNAAALTLRGTVMDTTVELWDTVMDVNVRAPFFLIQGAARIMRRESIEGTIVNIGSVSGYGSVPMLAPYAISKGAVMTMTKNAAYSLVRDRIRVNTLNLGWMDTPAEDAIQREFHGADAEWLERAEATMPFGRLLKPVEVAKAVAFLASAESGMMTGALIDFDQSVIGGGNQPILAPDEVPG